MLDNCIKACEAKLDRDIPQTALMSILAGMIIAVAAAVSNMVTFSIDNVSVSKTISGLIFPFGLAMIVVLGADLFTGNCLTATTVFDGRRSWCDVATNLLMVYLANCVGAVMVAAIVVDSGVLDAGNGQLALYTIEVCARKAAVPFTRGLLLGFLCNVMVTIGVLMAYAANNTAGKMIGAYIPVAFFVMCGFEHIVANFYYFAAGEFAVSVPEYYALAVEAGVDTQAITNIASPLASVTIGNIVGGLFIAFIIYYGKREMRVSYEIRK